MKKYNEFATEIALDGDKISIDEILNQELAILAFSTRNSRFSKCNNGNYIIIQVEIHGVKKVVFTASTVLYDQLTKYESQMPFACTIIKVGSYYTLK